MERDWFKLCTLYRCIVLSFYFRIYRLQKVNLHCTRNAFNTRSNRWCQVYCQCTFTLLSFTEIGTRLNESVQWCKFHVLLKLLQCL